MSKSSFHNEYQRALARADLEELRLSLQSAQRYVAGQSTPSDNDPDDPGFGDIHKPQDPEKLLALSVLAMAEFDDPGLIGFIAAGPLEDIFSLSRRVVVSGKPASADLIEDLLVRIENEARKTARFRWMLSGVWTSGFKPDHADRINRAIAGANMETDPLPPRPHA